MAGVPDVIDHMMSAPRTSVAGMFSGPRGSGFERASFVFDGERRWRIGTRDEAILEGGEAGYIITQRHVTAVSGGIATFGVLKAMVQPRRLRDISGTLPSFRSPQIIDDAFSHLDRDCWRVIALHKDEERREYVIDKATGVILILRSDEKTAALSALSFDVPITDELFAWNGEIDEDLRRPTEGGER